MRSGFRPDHKSFGAFILSEQAREPAVEAAQDVADIAQATAPRSTREGGRHFADSFKVNKNPAPKTVGGNPRAIAEVYNDVEHAAAVEFGGKRNRAERTLGRAGAVIGEFRGDLG